jgi:anti-sigma B factor antagonist
VLHNHPQAHYFHVSTEQRGSALVLRLTGEMDISCEDAFMATVEACRADGASELLIDLSKLTFIDSSGLRMLIKVWDQSRGNGLELSIVQGTGQVRRTIEVAGLDDFMPILDRGSSRP